MLFRSSGSMPSEGCLVDLGAQICHAASLLCLDGGQASSCIPPNKVRLGVLEWSCSGQARLCKVLLHPSMALPWWKPKMVVMQVLDSFYKAISAGDLESDGVDFPLADRGGVERDRFFFRSGGAAAGFMSLEFWSLFGGMEEKMKHFAKLQRMEATGCFVISATSSIKRFVNRGSGGGSMNLGAASVARRGVVSGDEIGRAHV